MACILHNFTPISYERKLSWAEFSARTEVWSFAGQKILMVVSKVSIVSNHVLNFSRKYEYRLVGVKLVWFLIMLVAPIYDRIWRHDNVDNINMKTRLPQYQQSPLNSIQPPWILHPPAVRMRTGSKQVWCQKISALKYHTAIYCEGKAVTNEFLLPLCARTRCLLRSTRCSRARRRSQE